MLEHGHSDVAYVYAERGEGDTWTSHAWLKVDGQIVDITADQFGQSAVIVSAVSRWHDEWRAEPGRPPICDPANWLSYPSAAWEAIRNGAP